MQEREIAENEKISATRTSPLLSIVIPSYSTERLTDIYDLLDSITRQSCTDFETLLVIDGSIALLKRIETYAREKCIPNLRLILNPTPEGAASARNEGVREARGKYIAFVDDDIVLFPNWVEVMADTLTKEDSAIGVMGLVLPLWEDQSMNWFPEELHWVIGCNSWYDKSAIKELRNAWTNNVSFRREAFEQAGLLCTGLGAVRGGGPHNVWLGEDVEFSIRVRTKTGKRILCNPGAKVWHKVHESRLKWTYIVRWSYWVGVSRCILKRILSGKYNGETTLAPEYDVVRRMYSRLLPRAIGGLVSDSKNALRIIAITNLILTAAAVGYLVGFSVKTPRYEIPNGRLPRQMEFA